MKRSDVLPPQRQSVFALGLMLFKMYKVFFKALWPALVLLLVNNNRNYTLAIIVLGVILVGAIVLAGIKYYRFQYAITEEGIAIESGIFTRKHTDIPFKKIQTIDFEQSVYHKICDVVKVNIDSAGSGKEEISLDAISAQDARLFKELALSKKSSNDPIVPDTDSGTTLSKEAAPIVHIRVWDLIKAGIVENHFRSGGILLFIIIGFYDRLRELKIIDYTEEEVADIIMGATYLLAFIGLFFFLSFLISLGRMVLKNYNLRLVRRGDGFLYRGGLLTTRQVSIKDHKIQVVTWRDNLLKRLIGFNDVFIKHASADRTGKKSSVKIPACQQHHIDSITQSIYGVSSDNQKVYISDKRMFTRFYMYVWLAFLPSISLLAYFIPHIVPIVTVFFSLVVLLQYFAWYNYSFAMHEDYLVVNKSVIGKNISMMHFHKIQSVECEQSPYQRRKDLATLTVYSAGGNLRLPYVSIDSGKQIMDKLLYEVERSKRPWM